MSLRRIATASVSSAETIWLPYKNILTVDANIPVYWDQICKKKHSTKSSSLNVIKSA